MKVLTNNKYYSEIANVIREQNGTNNTYKPPQMVNALKNLFYEEVEGVPPISFNGIGENLLDYRIDGASGGVGDKTSNLFDINSTTNKLINASLIKQDNNDYRLSDYIAIPNEGLNISGFTNLQSGDAIRFILYDVNKNIIERLFKANTIVNIDNTQGSYLRINYNINNWDMSNLIVVQGSTTPENYEPYGYKVPVVINGKNLLKNNATSQTINGVTFTVNDDGSVTCNGTANETVRHMLGGIALMSGVQYKMSGCPTNGANNTYRLDPRLTTGSVVVSFIDNGNGAVYTPNADVRINVYIYIQNGYTCDNLTFYPMIRLTTIEDDTYEPYIEPTITNIYLDEPILENESISMSDTNVSISTIRGTNTLTVDTEVQPSNVYVKSRKESSYENAMRQMYEETKAELDEYKAQYGELSGGGE